ncbi:pyruvate kinase alpha/beta domain-containing protein [Halorhabdus sp. CBA1104]|uniref:pyruvate kinase alpha/beta domain-containing protein n=1 Tax=Halorhabdus sp. CBA1104 TaxID=1380432 RepID=UPI001E50BF3D|nr:pyruvate kinase alpha/beta domain-containing protein [Halorhabdus sp. CBA1104]
MIHTDDMDTDAVLDEALDYAQSEPIDAVCVASTSGQTGTKAAERFGGDLVVVGHSYGYDVANEQELAADHVETIEDAGGEVFTGPMVFSNLGSAIAQKEGFSSHELVADVLRLFGQGTKVAVECPLMACDAGLVDAGDRVLSIAGTGEGADTILVVEAVNSREFFDSRVLEVVAKPADAENLVWW